MMMVVPHHQSHSTAVAITDIATATAAAIAAAKLTAVAKPVLASITADITVIIKALIVVIGIIAATAILKSCPSIINLYILVIYLLIK